MKRHTFLFDLDGTLTDPGLGITNSILYALGKMEAPIPKREALYPFIGPPLLDSFRKYCGMSEADAARALSLYREYFSVQGLFENEVYPGIPAMLARLADAGARLCVATSKPEPFARRILDHFDLAKFFSFSGGSGLDGARGKKSDVIAYVLAETGASSPDAVMIGDRLHDVEGAAACGLPAVGVLWGYGSRRELTDAGAAAVAATTDELEEILIHGEL